MRYLSIYKCVVIGTSAGGLNALSVILSAIPEDFPIPIAVVQHASPESRGFLPEFLNTRSPLSVKEADEKERLEGGNVYIAPPNYHLLIEENFTLSLTIDEKVNFARPSIDVLFETAAEAYRERLVGVLLTGANRDGAKGLKRITEMGGTAIVEDPATAEVPTMPAAGIREAKVDYVVPLEQIAAKLLELCGAR